MDDRLYLHAKFEEILGSRNVYFQPPESVQMKYPVIVYSLKNIKREYANNRGYIMIPGYDVTLIDKDPDSKYVKDIVCLPYCCIDDFFVSDNLNHWKFTIFNLKGGN